MTAARATFALNAAECVRRVLFVIFPVPLPALSLAQAPGIPLTRLSEFARPPLFEAASTYATIGLSDHLLELADGRQVRQELLFAAHDNYASDAIASFLLSFSEFVRSKSWALARGDVVGPSAALIPGVAVNSVYACPPVIFPEGLGLYSGSSPSTIIAWLVPLTGDEGSAAKRIGGDSFEEMLERSNPDLLDLNRPGIISG
ncbi:suppressor of fused domain protein [Burkholderia pseudomallei]|uniref:suppressor of fused domain protein n=1 Tax=Burkholderia pseudomallei TaxID=28450 RepID=UPI0021563780|nr:suppressor of fused domain protein [Burkholderia pseudomallei]